MQKHKAMAEMYARKLLAETVEELKKFDLRNAHLKGGMFTPELPANTSIARTVDGATNPLYSEVVQQPMSLALIR